MTDQPSRRGGAMTTDRELLERAAKAVGMVLTDNGVRNLGQWEFLRNGDREWGLYANNANGSQRRWNPIIDDGDALRLAVKLGIRIETWLNRPLGIGGKVEFGDGNAILIGEGEQLAETRRAIVRAAAAMEPPEGDGR